MDFSFQLYLEGQYLGVSSSQLTLRRVFVRYYLMKLSVEDVRRLFLKLDTVMCNVYCSFLKFISLLYIIYFTCFGNVNI